MLGQNHNLRLVRFAAVVLGFIGPAANAEDPLASWNDGPAKQAILEFVKATTTQGSPQFVPPEARIAAFDQDGTLWVEHPMYTQVTYCFERVPALIKQKPELKNREPFKTVLSGNREAMAKLSTNQLVEILGATLSGMSVDEFKAEAKKWLSEAKDARWKRPYTELTYQPMQELLHTCALTATKLTSLLVADRTLCGYTRIRPMAFHRKKSSALPGRRNLVMIKTANRSLPRNRNCSLTT